jgi:hypothetical protein
MLCRRYRFADPRTALLGEALLGFPTRLEEYSVPVALYDFGYNLGIAQRLLPGSDLGEAIEIYRDVTQRWNADQIRLLRLAAAAAAGGDRSRVRRLVEDQADRVRRHDDELRALVARALALVERIVSRARGEAVRAHARGRLISVVAFSAALAACESTSLTPSRDAGTDVVSSVVDSGPTCPDNLTPLQQLPAALDGCGGYPANVTFDQFGVPGALYQVDGGMAPQDVLDCMQRLLAGYCFPSYAGTTQTLVSHHIWIA